MSMWSNNVCEECAPSLEKGNDRASFQNPLKSFKIGTLVHLTHFPCTLSVNVLYNGRNSTEVKLNVCI